MAFAPLLLTGNLEIDSNDVSEQVTSFKFMGSRATVDIPETFGTAQSFAPAADTYQVEIGYLQDVDATALTQIFWAAISDADGTVTVSGTMRPGPISATNPQWQATALVTGVGTGGDVKTIGVDSQTFPLIGKPVQDTGV